MTNTTAHADMHRAMVALITKRREAALAALVMRTAYEWNELPTTRVRVSSWSDFGWAADKRGMGGPHTRMTWAMFKEIRNDGVSVTFMVPFGQLTHDD
jgi:hypothetical protein